MGNARQAPRRAALGHVCLFLEVINFTKVGLDNGVLLDVFNLPGAQQTVGQIRCEQTYTREVADQFHDII